MPTALENNCRNNLFYFVRKCSLLKDLNIFIHYLIILETDNKLYVSE